MKHCVKCKTKDTDDSKYCKNCGDKLIHEKDLEAKKPSEHYEEAIHKKSSKAWIWFLIIGILSVAVVAMATIQIPYIEKVTYTENVPVNKVEKYSDTEPYTDNVCNSVDIKYTTKWGQSESSCLQQKCAQNTQDCVETNWLGNCVRYQDRCIRYECEQYRIYCKLDVKNIDDTAGAFSLKGYVIDANNQKIYVQDVSIYVQAQDTVTAIWTYVYNSPAIINNCIYDSLKVSQRTKCENVIKTRTVSKERTVVGSEKVERQKEEVKYRTIMESLGWM
ncbi:MAG: hypothetical protein A4E71_00548 [Smithella sp. PtaU1.Bin162]|nr:MAG: hypothetical protein A4E71_00548 [Smithella sp. PtaU1.Bin162]